MNTTDTQYRCSSCKAWEINGDRYSACCDAEVEYVPAPPTVTINGQKQEMRQLTLEDLLPGRTAWGKLITSVQVVGYPFAGVPIKHYVTTEDGMTCDSRVGSWVPVEDYDQPRIRRAR